MCHGRYLHRTRWQVGHFPACSVLAHLLEVPHDPLLFDLSCQLPSLGQPIWTDMPVPLHPRHRTDVVLTRVGEGWLLFDPATTRVHRLNQIGLLVWQCCDGTACVADISAELADVFPRAGRSDHRISEATRRRFRSRRTARRHGQSRSRRALRSSPRRRWPANGPAVATSRTPGPALDLRITIDCHDSMEVADEIERSLGEMAGAIVPVTSHRDVTLAVWADDVGGWYLEAGRQPAARPPTRPSWPTTCCGRSRAWRSERSSRYLIVHSSAVALVRNRRCVPGTSQLG